MAFHTNRGTIPNQLQSLFGNITQTQTAAPAQTSQNFTGQFSDFIGSALTNTINQGGFSDNLRAREAQGRRDIGRQTRGARESIRESGASSGFRGANANLFNQLFESQSSAVTNLELGIGREAESRQQQALTQLIGFNTAQQQLGLSAAQFEEGIRQFDITTERGRREFELAYGLKVRELDILEDSQPGFLENLVTTFVGGVIGGATGGLSTAIGAGLSSLFSGDPDPDPEP